MHKPNKEQEKAIKHIKGPLLIVAGAGTGKTSVITQKINFLIENKHATPENILSLTFTEKAAEEMKDRVEGLLNDNYSALEISTFHSFCQKILEYYGLDMGLPNEFKILTDTDAWLLIRKNLSKFKLEYYAPLGNPTKHIHEFIKHFSKCKDELISPNDYLKYANSKKTNKKNDDIEISRLKEIANAYKIYNEILLDNSALDFGDLIFYTIKLLETRPKILSDLQDKFKFIMVDEFQDVNWGQYYLVKLLAGKDSNLTVVGDDDQSIYAFRGASVSNIMHFKDDYPSAKQIILTENYRSDQEILDFSYKLIAGNNPDRLEVKLKIDKKLKSNVSKKGKSVLHLHYKTSEEEVLGVIKEIDRLKNIDKTATWDDFAILIRANTHAEPFLTCFENLGIPYEFLASAGLYRQPIILDCISFLKTIDNYHESDAVFRLLKMSVLNLPDKDLVKLNHFSKKKSISLFSSLKKIKEIKLSNSGVKSINKLLDLINEGSKKTREEKVVSVLYNFLKESGYLSFLAKGEDDGISKIIREIYHLKQFFEYLSRYESTTLDANVHNFLEHYRYVLESGDKGSLYQPKDTPDSVNIVTVHKAKGLEFKYVFVVNLVEERFPSKFKGGGIEVPLDLIKEKLPEGDSRFQEERRLFYVAMTRAKNRLYLTSADNYGGKRDKKVSRFLVELEMGTIKQDMNNKSVHIPKIEKKKEEKGKIIFELPKLFSYSQIKSYQTCPYQYKLFHILHIPTKGSASSSFGQTMHNTFQEFYKKIQELNFVKPISVFNKIKENEIIKPKKVKVPSFSELLEIYESNWIENWYDSKAQRLKYYEKGKDILNKFYESENNSWTVPLGLESWFNIKIGEYGLHGRIDRIDRLENDTLEIIDYKTGKSKEKLKYKDKEQLLIYQIATERLEEFNSLGLPGKLTFFYLNDNLKTSFLGKDKDKEKLEENLIKTMSSIHKRNFKPTPNKVACNFCDFKDMCEYRN